MGKIETMMALNARIRNLPLCSLSDTEGEQTRNTDRTSIPQPRKLHLDSIPRQVLRENHFQEWYCLLKQLVYRHTPRSHPHFDVGTGRELMVWLSRFQSQ